MGSSNTMPWYWRWLSALRYSVRWRLMLVFLLLAFALTAVFTVGVQRAVLAGWNHLGKPLVTDYVERLRDDIGNPPDIATARAIAERLPLTISIRGPQVQWDSSPHIAHRARHWRDDARFAHRIHDEDERNPFWVQTSADGHTIVFGLQRHIGIRWSGWWALGLLLLITALAYRYVRYLLKPLDAIGTGTQRYGKGHFDQPIVLRNPEKPDELDALAQMVNTMGSNIHGMLEAKRTLLLAISHELRSPITRARLNTELLPETPDFAPQRTALLRDLHVMATLVNDLLESERLAEGHTALQRESISPLDLINSVLVDYPQVRLIAAKAMPSVLLDTVRVSLLLRNLLGNAARHAQRATQPTELHASMQGAALAITVRDFGPGVDAATLQHLGQAFYRPDNARTREAGGTGLGLYLCRIIAQAHGGALRFENASPGLRVVVHLPGVD